MPSEGCAVSDPLLDCCGLDDTFSCPEVPVYAFPSVHRHGRCANAVGREKPIENSEGFSGGEAVIQ
jgi:hypothetical protein